ncbi:unnamed protein product [Linum trigynum]|uniref:Fe2OG dioxygenase domain-containing protein n=1 Tax=Linum trigynum TaxID=586398 RepID=A0AAV2DV66_9ROSI
MASSAAYDRLAELKSFDETKAGVKGLLHSGITDLPRIFHFPPHLLDHRPSVSAGDPNFTFPVIDLESEGVRSDPDKRNRIVERIRDASSNWGFFQVVNHGIPETLLDEMKAGVHKFHDQTVELKKQFYGRDPTKKVYYNSNFDLFDAPAASWRDSALFHMAPDPPSADEIPACFGGVLTRYSEEMLRFGDLLFRLLSEALGLRPNHLKEMGCADGLLIGCHYYPPCPQPELTLGTDKHSDVDFATVLLQDRIGGFQVLHKDCWVDVPPLAGGLVVNIGDMLQLISNDKFISAQHRVLSKTIGPRVSVPAFFSSGFSQNPKVYGPIKELLCENSPPRYQETTTQNYRANYYNKGLDGKSRLLDFKL